MSVRTVGRSAVALLLLLSAAARAQTRDSAARPMTEFALDSQVVFAPGSPAPRYPESLRGTGIVGVTVVQVVVDSAGLPMVGSLKVVRSAHPAFTESVRAAIGEARFVAARVGPRHVRQLVQIVYAFGPEGTGAADALPLNAGIRTLRVSVSHAPGGTLAGVSR